MGLPARFDVHAAFVAASARVLWAYRFNVLIHFVSICIQIVLLRAVWTAVYGGRDQVEGVDLAALLSYLTLANVQVWLMWPAIPDLIQQRVRDGSVGSDLARPFGFIERIVTTQLGLTVGRLPLLLVGLPLAGLVGSLQPPASAIAGVAAIVGALLGYLISVHFGLIVGLAAFWMHDIRGMYVIYLFVVRFFAGALIPLWLFPDGLRAVAEYLPFQAMAYGPLAIYVGRLGGQQIVAAIASALIWLLLLHAAARVMWRRAHRIVVVQGG